MISPWPRHANPPPAERTTSQGCAASVAVSSAASSVSTMTRAGRKAWVASASSIAVNQSLFTTATRLAPSGRRATTTAWISSGGAATASSTASGNNFASRVAPARGSFTRTKCTALAGTTAMVVLAVGNAASSATPVSHELPAYRA